jgi:S-layer family protein
VLPVWTDQRSGQRVYTDRGILPLVTPSPTATAQAPSATATPTNTATSVPPTGTATAVAPTSTPSVPPATATGGVPTATHVAASATPVAGSPTATPTLCPITFSDVQATDYFYEPVRYLYCHGVISGYGDNTFRPYNDTTRAQMVKIVVLGFGIAIQTPAAGGYTFHDVPPTAPFFDVIETAAARGIVSGYTCGPGGPGPCDTQNRPYFLPNNPVTRGKLSKIDVIAAGWAQINPSTPTFTDVPANSTFYTVIETAVCHGVVSGYADHTFHPFANATRGQISKIVYLSITGPVGACAVTPTR